MLWLKWCKIVWELRPASGRLRNFMWFAVALAGFTIRSDLAGVTSTVRALGLQGKYYKNLLNFFHSTGLDFDKLTKIWSNFALKIFSTARTNGRLVLLGDGIKVSKEGKKMPAVKSLHQASESNSKSEYIMGHSLQAVSLLVGAMSSFFAVPLICRIHEGVVFSNRNKKTLLDKMILLIESLNIDEPFYFIADAYYASRIVIVGLLAQGNHLISRVRSNAVAYYPVIADAGGRGRGRPRKYGKKIALRNFFNDPSTMQKALSPIYGEKKVMISYRTIDLIWKSVGILVRFVIVIHPTRGKIILLSTDLSLSAIEIIRNYGLRFKIEVSFKQALHTIGTFCYHFWMMEMLPLRRFSGDQYLHRKNDMYRNAVRRKIAAYHRYIQTGLIAQGILQYLSSTFPEFVWSSFGSWLRTIRPNICPSEQVTATAMRNTLPKFIADSHQKETIVKFILDRIDFDRQEGLRLTG